MSSFNEYFTYREEVDTSIEITNLEQEVQILVEWKKTHPGKNVSKKERSEIVKKARKGENVFGGEFNKVADKATKEYGSEKAGKRVAAAAMWRKAKGKHMTKEEVDDLLWILEDDIKVMLDHLEVILERKKKWIQKAHLKKGRCTPAPNPDCPKGSRQYALAMRFKHGDLHDS